MFFLYLNPIHSLIIKVTFHIRFRMVILNHIFNVTNKACSMSSLNSLNKLFANPGLFLKAKLNKVTTVRSNLFSTSQPMKMQRIDPKRFQPRSTDTNTQNLIWYTMGGLVIMGGMSYAAVPLFKIFCESQGKNFTVFLNLISLPFE